MAVIDVARIALFLKKVTNDSPAGLFQISRYASRLGFAGQRSNPAAASACVFSDVTVDQSGGMRIEQRQRHHQDVRDDASRSL